MKRILVFACLALPAAVQAQSLELDVYAGVTSYGRFLDLAGTQLGGGVPPEPVRLVNLTLTALAAPVAGLGVAWLPGGRFRLRLDVTATETRLDLYGISAAPAETATEVATVGGVGEVQVGTASLDVQYRPGGESAALAPFVAVGAGVRYFRFGGLDEVDRLAPVTGLLLADASPRGVLTFGGVVAVGVDVGLAPGRRLRLELRDHVGTNPWSQGDFVKADGQFFREEIPGRPDLVHNVQVVIGLGVGPGWSGAQALSVQHGTSAAVR